MDRDDEKVPDDDEDVERHARRFIGREEQVAVWGIGQAHNQEGEHLDKVAQMDYAWKLLLHC